VNREQLLNRLDSAWGAFQASYAGLSSSRLTESGVAGDWSVKDVVAHVTWWEEEALRHLPLILAGGRSPRYSVTYGGIDAFNAMMTEQKRDAPLSDILTEQIDTHQRLIDFVQSVPEDQFTRETRFRRRLRLDTYGHYPIHTNAIREWRQRRSL
jgi:Mycothiol maleylpyruvate isomerase N-terminal domain